MFYRNKVLARNWLDSVEHLWHSFCQYSSLNEPALYPQENKSNGRTLRWSMVSVYIIFKLDVLCNVRLPKFLAKNITNCTFDELRFPYCLRINTYSPNCGVFKFYFNLHIVHVAVKLFQNNIVRGAEIFPSIRIYFFELPEVWWRIAIAKKGWGCGLWRVIWKCYFISRDLKIKNRNCYSSVFVTSYEAML